MLLLTTRQLIFFVILLLSVILPGCTSAKKTKSGVKVGMHIDAVLEFIVEYPLSWNKDRRLPYGSKNGEVRWAHPKHPDTSLTIRSDLQKRQDLSKEQQVDQVVHEYVGLDVAIEEEITLPAGESWHITGKTAQLNVDIYLLLNKDRSYLIALTAPADKIDLYEDLMARVTQSFQTIPE